MLDATDCTVVEILIN